MLLPTNCTNRTFYEADKKVGEDAGLHIVAFRDLWQQFLPFIKTMSPATDLSWQCQTNISRLTRCVNLGDEQKTEAMKLMEDHQSVATKERSYYTKINKFVKDALPTDMVLGPHPPCSYSGTVHYSFDFAQQFCTHPIHYSRGQFFSKPQENAAFLESTARL